MSNKLTLVKRSVNSKTLAAGIEAFTTEAINDILGEGGGNWTGRDWFVELTYAFLYDVAVDGKIVQWDVICDSRNNKILDMDAGRLNIDIKYKQYDCVNTTKFSYTLSAEDDDKSNDSAWEIF